MQYIFAYEQFFGHTHDLVTSVLVKNDDIVKTRAVEQILGVIVLLKRSTKEALLPVYIQFFVCLGHLGSFD